MSGGIFFFFLSSQLEGGRGTTSIECIEARDPMKHPAIHNTALHPKNQSVQPQMSMVPRLRNLFFC